MRGGLADLLTDLLRALLLACVAMGLSYSSRCTSPDRCGAGPVRRGVRAHLLAGDRRGVPTPCIGPDRRERRGVPPAGDLGSAVVDGRIRRDGADRDLRRDRRAGGLRHARAGARTRDHPHRHRGGLRQRRQRAHGRSRDRCLSRPGAPGHQVQLPPIQHGASALVGGRAALDRGEPRASGRRPHRHLVPAPRSGRPADRINLGADGRGRRGRGGAVPGHLGGQRGNHPPGARRTPDHRAAERMVAA